MRWLFATVLASGIVMAQTVTVPLIVEGNAPIVELEFPSAAGVRKARFLVDTGGGGALILGSKLIADIGAEPTGPASQGRNSMVPLKPMPVKLGGLTLNLTGVRIVGTPKRLGPSARDDAEGLLPGSLLKHYEVVFDYPARLFTLAKPGATTPRGTKIKTSISLAGHPRIELRIGGETRGFLLDTGASFTMISHTVLERWAKANPGWPTAIGAVGFANMFGGPVENEALMLRIAEIGIGSITVKDVAAVSRLEDTFEKSMSRSMTAPIVGALAGNVLRDFRVEIDYKSGFTYLERATFNTDADLVSVGLVLESSAGRNLVVSGISSAATSDVKEQVHVGDKLLSVDDASMQGRPLIAVARALQGKAGERKRLSLERDGKVLAVSVTIEKLL